MRIRPLNDTLIVKLDEDQWTGMNKPDLIQIPDAYIGGYRKRATSGKVISWGNKCFYPFKEGQRVFFKFSDNRPGFEGHRFVKETELLAKDEDV